ncbi:serine/threonine-protein kinase [Actinomadura rupiterrae]|uniref:serine/threonine-protein kinase n=1 Tax=Actinomadura rupiterrae TaxID=559627 RepID=UPI0020A2C749|nr:serine/threonine-protein kinase [Actinomadura rupiterrae]MCP2340118.1 serine/threonine protein kinase [Actinomadura rupiterrae]
MPPKVIAGRYELLEVLGRGGMGAVWRARDRTLDREVAVKEVDLPPGLTADQVARVHARTLREARSAARLDHPGIVTVHDVVEEDGRPWIVMSLVRAPALDAFINRQGRPLPPVRVAAIGLDLLDALRHAHAAGVVHRDVKPGNVLLGTERAVLTDFGIASIAGDETLTQTGVVVGSPAYLAPEQARHQKATPASDLWSLGATLYAAVEGRPPFKRDDVWGVMAALLSDEPDPTRLAGPLTPVLTGLLQRDPDRRMGADEAVRALRQIVQAPAAVPSPPLGIPLVEPPKDPSVDDLSFPPPKDPSLDNPSFPPPQPPPPGFPTPPPMDAPTQPPARPGRQVPWPVIVPAAVFGVLILIAAVVLVVFMKDNSRNGASGAHPPTGPATAASPPVQQSPSASATPTQPLPSGYTLYNGSAFSAAYPTGWKIDDKGSGGDVTFQDPAPGVIRGISVFKATGLYLTNGLMLTEVSKSLSQSDAYRDYKEVGRKDSVPVNGHDAGELQFTFTRRADNGKDVQGRAVVRVFQVEGGAEAILMAAAQKDWDGGQGAYDEFCKTFTLK